MLKFKQNPNLIQEIRDVREKNGVLEYQVVWKQNSWVTASELQYCKNVIDEFHNKNGGEAANLQSQGAENHEAKEKTQIKKSDKATEENICEESARTSQVENLTVSVQRPDIKTEIEVTPEDKIKHREVMESCKFPDWYLSSEKKDKVNIALKSFNDKYCRYPDKKVMGPAKMFHDIMMRKLKEELNKNDLFRCQKIEFTGSTYEGLKITGDGLEFDVMILLKGGDKLDANPVLDEQGFRFLTPTNPEDPMLEKLLNKQYVSPKKLKSKFLGALQVFIDSENDYKDCVKLKIKGPAIQVDVKTKKGDKLWYSVDTVPTYEIKETKDSAPVYYVAKSHIETSDSWRQSFSLEEKCLLKAIDQGNECRREVIRTLKALFKRQSPLHKINSYILKTSLFHVSKYMSENVSWGDKEYSNRVFDMLGVIQGYLDKKWLPHYHVPTQNLLKDYKDATLDNVKNCIKGIRSSETKFFDAFDCTADFLKSPSSNNNP